MIIKMVYSEQDIVKLFSSFYKVPESSVVVYTEEQIVQHGPCVHKENKVFVKITIERDVP